MQEYVQYLNKQGSRIDFSATWDFFMESELDHIFNECMKQADLQLKRHTWHKEDENAEQVLSELQKEGYWDSEAVSNLPMKQEDVILVVDQVRQEVMAKFDDILRLAHTKEELDAIQSKMKQVEQEISNRVKPFEKKNQAVSRKHLEELDESAFATIKEKLAKDK